MLSLIRKVARAIYMPLSVRRASKAITPTDQLSDHMLKDIGFQRDEKVRLPSWWEHMR